MKITIEGNYTEVEQLINNISNNAKTLSELITDKLIIDEDKFIVNSFNRRKEKTKCGVIDDVVIGLISE